MTSIRSLRAGALAGFALLATSGAHAAYYLNDLGSGVIAVAVNNANTVLEMNREANPVLWNGGVLTALPAPGAASAAWVTSLNDRGVVAGDAYFQGTWYTHAAVWSGQSSQDLGTLASSSEQVSTQSLAYGINNQGQVVGDSMLSAGSRTYATLWSSGQIKNLGSLDVNGGSHASDINNLGQVVGVSWVAGVPVATRWQGDTLNAMGNLSGASSAATAVNDAGQAVGWMGLGAGFDSSTVQHAAFWNGGNAQDLGTLGGFESEAVAINSVGLIVGSSEVSMLNKDRHAVLWQGGQIIDLNGFLTDAQKAEGWVLTSATGVNDEGWIVGQATRGWGDPRAFLLTTSVVPEADTLTMSLMTLGGLMLVVRRRRQPG